jgi:hypothetical protein
MRKIIDLQMEYYQEEAVAESAYLLRKLRLAYKAQNKQVLNKLC